LGALNYFGRRVLVNQHLMRSLFEQEAGVLDCRVVMEKK
jgi:hypothetical protein